MTIITTLLEVIASVPLWAVVTVGIITVIYKYLTWEYNHWESQGVKCDKPWPLIGTMGNPFKTPQEVHDMQCMRKYGKVYGIYEGPNPSLHVGDPDLLKQILVKDFNKFINRRVFEIPASDKIFRNMITTMEGEEWKQHRNIVTPSFTTGKMKQMLSVIEECAAELVGYVRKHSTSNEAIDVQQCLASFSLDVIARCAFGTKINFLGDNPDTDFAKHVSSIFSSPPKLAIIIFIFPKLGKYLPRFISEATSDYFTNLVTSVINVRKKEKNTRKDFLQIITDAKAEFDKGNYSLADGHTFNSKYPLTLDTIVGISVNFMLGGYETTATTLSFALYELALNHDVQEKLISEIDDVMAEHDGKLDYQIIGEMQYLDMVVSETLRMYPAAPRLERSCLDDCELNGIKLKKNWTIGIPIYAIHHYEEFYPEPEKFDPDRFSPENKTKRNPYTFLPFGHGPRNCIGMRFALMELKISLAYIFKEFRIKTNSTTDVPYIRNMNAVMLKPVTMNLVFESRN